MKLKSKLNSAYNTCTFRSRRMRGFYDNDEQTHQGKQPRVVTSVKEAHSEAAALVRQMGSFLNDAINVLFAGAEMQVQWL